MVGVTVFREGAVEAVWGGRGVRGVRGVRGYEAMRR